MTKTKFDRNKRTKNTYLNAPSSAADETLISLEREKGKLSKPDQMWTNPGSLIPCNELCFLTEGIIVEVSRKESYARPSSNRDDRVQVLIGSFYWD